MPSERLSPRKRTRLAMGVCLVLLCPLACASFYKLDDANQWQHVQVPAPAPAAR